MNDLAITTYWLGRAGALALLTALVTSAWILMRDGGSARTRLAAYVSQLQLDINFLQLKVTGWTCAGLQATALAVGLALIVLGVPFFGIALGVAALLVRPYISKQRLERVTRLEAQLEPWLEALSNALRASPSLGEALASTARLLNDPIRSELELVLKENRLGTPLDAALDHVATRIGSRTVKTAFLTLRIARNTGGNLPETLKTSAKSLREMARLDGVVRTKTAEGKAQAIVIGAIPFPLYGSVAWMSPGSFDPLHASGTGTLISFIAVGLWLSAIISAQKILAVDI